MNVKMPKETIEKIIKECRSFRELVIKLGRKPVGGNVYHISNMCKRYGIDTSHMTGKSWLKGRVSHKRQTSKEVLVLGVPNNGRKDAAILRRSLLEEGVEYKCSQCGITEWNDQSLVLHVDHKNGQYWDNRKRNLRFICPNCHSQTPNFGSKNMRC